MRTKGKIASWNGDKGYGFISPLIGGKQIFILGGASPIAGLVIGKPGRA